MSIGLLGDVVLENLEVVGLEQDTGADYSEHKPTGQKPILQANGAGLTELKLTLSLHIETCNIDARRTALQTMCSKQLAAPLVIGSDYRGWFVITSLSIVEQWLDDKGNVLSQSISLSLKEWTGSRTVKATAPAMSNGVAPVGMQLQSPSSQTQPAADTSPALRRNLRDAVTANMQTLAAVNAAIDAAAVAEKLSDAQAQAQTINKLQAGFKQAQALAQQGVNALTKLSETYQTVTASIDQTRASIASVQRAADALKPPVNLATLADKLKFAQGQLGDAGRLTAYAAAPMTAIAARLAVRSSV